MLRYLFGFVLITISSMIFEKYKRKQSKYNINHTYDLVSRYFMTDIPSDTKNIVWIHMDNEINSRKWLHWGSRNTTNLNQPFLNITLKSIIEQSKGHFHVCIIDDNSFEKLLPDFTIRFDSIPNHSRNCIRNIAMLKVLQKYGGIVVPLSYVAIKPLSNLFTNGLKNNDVFVCKTVHTEINAMNENDHESILFMGAKKNAFVLSEMIDQLEKLYSTDFTDEKTILNKTITILHFLAKQDKINTIDATYIGCKDRNAKNITIDMLFSDHPISFDTSLQGILLPQNEILKRSKYNWFSVLPLHDIFYVQNNIGRILTNSMAEKMNDVYMLN